MEIHGSKSDDLRATGEVVWVYANQETGKSAPLPDEFIKALESFEGALP